MEFSPLHITAKCPIRTTLELVGGKWKLLILFQLREGELRLSALRQQIPDISEKMLIQELKHLVQSDLVWRKNYGEVPPKVAYGLTAKGMGVLPLITAMRDFALRYEEQPDGQSPA